MQGKDKRPTNHASFLSTEQQSNHHGSTLPPVPPPHRQQPSITALNQSLGSTHHAGQSLNSTRQLTPPTGSPAPVAGQSPAELQTTPPESVPLQDSWVLGSNVPLETRYADFMLLFICLCYFSSVSFALALNLTLRSHSQSCSRHCQHF